MFLYTILGSYSDFDEYLILLAIIGLGRWKQQGPLNRVQVPITAALYPKCPLLSF